MKTETNNSLPAAAANLPQGWRMARFDEIAESIGERVEPGDADTEYYVGLEHLDTDSLKIRRWGTPDDVEATKLRFTAGDIIFGRRRVYQRKVAVAEFDGICSAHAMVIRAREEAVEKGFLPFLMQSSMFMERALAISVGSLSPTINWSVLRRQEFPLPPKEEQRWIAEVLWAADQVLQRWEEGAVALAQLRAARLDEIFNTARAKRDAGWSIVPLHSVSDLQTGLALGREFPGVETREMPYLRVANVQDGYLDLTEIKRVVLPVTDVQRYLLKTGDVLMTEGGDFDKLGRGTIWRGQIAECLHQNHVFCVRPKQAVMLPEYLSYQTASTYGRSYFLRCAKKTSNLASINSTQVKQFPVLLCPLQTQKALVAGLEHIDARAGEVTNHIRSAVQLKRELVLRMLSGSDGHVQ